MRDSWLNALDATLTPAIRSGTAAACQRRGSGGREEGREGADVESRCGPRGDCGERAGDGGGDGEVV